MQPSSPLRPPIVRRLLRGLLVALFAALPGAARAGGLYLTPLGAEPAGRAGARVAGVSTPHALWYNPAGLAHAKRQLVLDLNGSFVRASFTRFLDDGSTAPTAHARAQPVPRPMLAYSDDFGLPRWGFGFGVVLPPTYALDWPSQVDGQPAPQRYGIVGADKTSLGSLALAAAYRPFPALSIGAALYLTAARVGGELAVSACAVTPCSDPEARAWEGRARYRLGPLYTATAVFGLRYDLARVRLGASVQVRTKIAGQADLDLTLPDGPPFSGATVRDARGNPDLKADVKVTLPRVARFGVEVDVTRALAMELATTWEAWSQQGDVAVRPRGVFVNGVRDLGSVRASDVVISRGARDTWALALGGTHDLSLLTRKRRALSVSAGAMYESSATRTRDVSPAFMDTEKVLLSLGASVGLSRRVLLDVSYGHLFMRNRTVRDSAVRLPEAIQAEPRDPLPRIGNGRYAMEANYLALGLRVKLDGRP